MSSEPMSAEVGGQDEGLDRRLLAIASVVVLGAIMSILDTTVVNVAINTLSRDFETDLATIQWIVTGYTLALATVIPITVGGTVKEPKVGLDVVRAFTPK